MACFIKLHKFADTLKNVEIDVQKKDKPKFDRHQALLRVLCAPINSTDLYALTGVLGAFLPDEENMVPGLECVAIVEDVGCDVTKVTKGQRVVPILMPELPTMGVGSWQEYLAISEDRLILVPEGVSDETAAQFFVNHFTPYALFKTAKIPKGEWLIQNAASGVVGRQIIKLAKHFGINVINLVRQHSQVKDLEVYGGENILCIEENSRIISSIVNITKAKLAYAGFDAVGWDNGVIISNSLAPGKTAYLYGLMGGLELKVFSHSILFRNVRYEGFWIVRYIKERDFSKVIETSNELMNLIKDGVVDSLTGTKMEFSQIKDAIAAAQSPLTSKILLVPKLEEKAVPSPKDDISVLEETLSKSLVI